VYGDFGGGGDGDRVARLELQRMCVVRNERSVDADSVVCVKSTRKNSMLKSNKVRSDSDGVEAPRVDALKTKLYFQHLCDLKTVESLTSFEHDEKLLLAL
jgi:hypothetical protein